MPSDEFGATGTSSMLFALQRDDGKWIKCKGSISFVDGHFHKVAVAGSEFRSGESFGLTGVFYTFVNIYADGPIYRADLTKMIVEAGRLVTTDVSIRSVELAW